MLSLNLQTHNVTSLDFLYTFPPGFSVKLMAGFMLFPKTTAFHKS